MDSDCLSISESSSDQVHLDEGAHGSHFFRRALHRLWEEFKQSYLPNWEMHCTQASPGNHNSGNGSSGHASSSQTGNTSSATGSAPPNRRGKRTVRAGDGGDDGEDDRSTLRSAKRLKSESARIRLFACPYWKLDAGKHRECYRYRLQRIRDVKQHLSRKHTPEHYCECCLVIFPDAGSHEEHVTHRNGVWCTRDSTAELDGISHSKSRELSKKSNPRASEAEQWFQIWDTLLPTAVRPRSPYMDSEMSEDVCAFHEFFERRGPDILAEEMQSDLAWSSVHVTPQERNRYLRRLLTGGLHRIWDAWTQVRHTALTPGATDRAAGSIVSQDASLVQYPSRIGTTAHSIDSGIAVSQAGPSGFHVPSGPQPISTVGPAIIPHDEQQGPILDSGTSGEFEAGENSFNWSLGSILDQEDFGIFGIDPRDYNSGFQ